MHFTISPICTASTPLLMSVCRGLFGKSAFGVDVVVFCVSQTRKKICPLGAACAQLSRPCMKRICHGADACARVCICAVCSFALYLRCSQRRRPTQFSQPETASCAPSWASTQTRVTLVELKCKLKSF